MQKERDRKTKKASKLDLSRSPDDAAGGTKGNRLNMSQITGQNTGYSVLLGRDESDGGGGGASLRQGLVPKSHKPAKKYQNPSKK